MIDLAEQRLGCRFEFERPTVQAVNQTPSNQPQHPNRAPTRMVAQGLETTRDEFQRAGGGFTANQIQQRTHVVRPNLSCSCRQTVFGIGGAQIVRGQSEQRQAHHRVRQQRRTAHSAQIVQHGQQRQRQVTATEQQTVDVSRQACRGEHQRVVGLNGVLVIAFDHAFDHPHHLDEQKVGAIESGHGADIAGLDQNGQYNGELVRVRAVVCNRGHARFQRIQRAGKFAQNAVHRAWEIARRRSRQSHQPSTSAGSDCKRRGRCGAERAAGTVRDAGVTG